MTLRSGKVVMGGHDWQGKKTIYAPLVIGTLHARRIATRASLSVENCGRGNRRMTVHVSKHEKKNRCPDISEPVTFAK